MQKKKRPLFTTLMVLCLTFSFNSQAVELNAADWFLSVNVATIKSSPLGAIIEEKSDADDDEAIALLSHVFGPDLPEQINEVNIYGSVNGEDDFSILVQGDFTTSSKAAFFAHENLRVDSRDITFGSHTIQELTINENTAVIGFDGDEDIADVDTDVVVYAAEVRPDVLMLSRDLQDVKNWLSGQHDFSQLSQNGIFSMVVNVQEALARGGIKVDDHHHAFQSDLMKKLSQISFNLIEDGENMLIEAALSATDNDTAAQIQQVLNGLVALNALSNKNLQNDFGAQLLSNLKIESNGNNIIVSSYAPFALIDELKAQHMIEVDITD